MLKATYANNESNTIEYTRYVICIVLNRENVTINMGAISPPYNKGAIHQLS